jgi:hypothetical protein
MGLPDYDATRYERRVRSGGMLISIRCGNADWAGGAKKSCATPEPKKSAGN